MPSERLQKKTWPSRLTTTSSPRPPPHSLAGVYRRHYHLRRLRDPSSPPEPTQAWTRALRQREAAGGRAGAGGSQTSKAQHWGSNVEATCSPRRREMVCVASSAHGWEDVHPQQPAMYGCIMTAFLGSCEQPPEALSALRNASAAAGWRCSLGLAGEVVFGDVEGGAVGISVVR